MSLHYSSLFQSLSTSGYYIVYCNVVLQCFCTYTTLISSLWWWWWWHRVPYWHHLTEASVTSCERQYSHHSSSVTSSMLLLQWRQLVIIRADNYSVQRVQCVLKIRSIKRRTGRVEPVASVGDYWFFLVGSICCRSSSVSRRARL